MFTKEQIQEARQQGLSLQEIAEKLKCSKSTVSKYCRGIKFDRTIIINKARESGKLACLKLHKKWQEKKKFVSEEAIKNWMIAKNDPLLMGFLGLYWGEGSKSSGVIAITNNDHLLIKAALDGFRKLDPEAKIVADIRCYKSHDKGKLMEFWKSFLPGVDIRLSDVYDKRIKHLDHVHERCIYGNCRLQFSNWKVFTTIMTWLECWKSGL